MSDYEDDFDNYEDDDFEVRDLRVQEQPWQGDLAKLHALP